MTQFTPHQPRANRDEILHALAVLTKPGTEVELRAIGVQTHSGEKPHPVSLRFTDLDELANTALALDASAKGIYITLNPLKDGTTGSTADTDIAERRWFPVDIDPKRPANTAASDEEHDGASRRAAEIRDFLTGLGWPEPVEADSGNGAHLLYRVELLNDDASRKLVQNALKALDVGFSGDGQNVDTGVHNAARIWKLYGSVARKGLDTPERPHRMAQVLHVPSELGIVTREQLEALAALLPDEHDAVKDSEPSGKALDAAAWLAEQGVEVDRVNRRTDCTVYRLVECPWADEHSDGVDGAAVIQLASGALVFKCWHAHCAERGWRDLRVFLEPDAYARQDAPAAAQHPYSTADEGISMLKRGEKIQLTNFTAHIVSDVVKDDGVEKQRAMEIKAVLAGGAPVRFTIPAAQFANLGWAIEQLGPKAVVFPGYDAQSNARAAIQLLSEDITTRHVYTHLGWRKLANGAWVYLHTEGGVGANWSGWSGSSEKWSGQNSQPDHGISGNEADASNQWSGWSGTISGETALDVSITGLPHYTLPSTCGSREELRDAVQASLRMLDVAALRLTVPVYAAIWRAALGNCDFSLHISGKSGAGKSALAALTVQHFGRGMDARHLPGNWSSTDNALGGLQFVAKDALLVVDEFKPIGTAQDIARWHAKADRVLRAQGNGSGRQRMRADATLREEKPPRCLTLSTGEDNPRGDSLQARMLILAMSKEDMDWTRLTAAQQDASSGQYALAMAGYLSWLAPQYEGIRTGLGREMADLRDRIVGRGQHQRTPEIVANLLVGIRHFLKFAIEVGAVSEVEGKRLWVQSQKYLALASISHAAQQANERPTRRFADLLQSALMSGKAHVASAVDGKRPKQNASAWGWGDSYPNGDRIGWVDGDDLYLAPTAARNLACRIAQEGNEAFPLTERMLSQHLYDEKLLLAQEAARESRSVRKMIAGNRVAVLHLHTSFLLSPVLEPDQPDQKVA
jgi:uncharacterized protein DUF927